MAIVVWGLRQTLDFLRTLGWEMKHAFSLWDLGVSSSEPSDYLCVLEFASLDPLSLSVTYHCFAGDVIGNGRPFPLMGSSVTGEHVSGRSAKEVRGRVHRGPVS